MTRERDETVTREVPRFHPMESQTTSKDHYEEAYRMILTLNQTIRRIMTMTWAQKAMWKALLSHPMTSQITRIDHHQEMNQKVFR